MVYFESIPSRDRSLILAGGIAFFWLIETAFPLFKFSYKKFEKNESVKPYKNIKIL